MPPVSPAMMKSLEIVKRYSAQKEYHPLLRRSFNTPELQEMFWASLNHEIQLISQHSQELEDHEINLTQKAFKMLHSQGNLVSTANVYIELILGIAATSSGASLNHVLAINRAHGARNADLFQGKANLEAPGQSNKQADFLKSLLHVYEEAKDAFQKAPPKSIDATRAAKFLRDTSENLISYMRSIETPNGFAVKPNSAEIQQQLLELLEELRETLEHTNKFVESRCGGKKRVWEQSSMQQDRVKHSLQDLDVNEKVEPGMDERARKFLKENADLTQPSCHRPLDATLPRPQQPGTLTTSARRRKRRNRPAAVKRVQPENTRQSATARSHQGKGRRNVLPDCYRPNEH